MDVTRRLGRKCARMRRAGCLLETGICRSVQRMSGVTIPQAHQSVSEKSRAWRQLVQAESSGKANTQPRIVHPRAERATWPERVVIHCLPAMGLSLAARGTPSGSDRRSIKPHPKKLFAVATVTSLSSGSRGNVNVPFSNEHRLLTI